jgi:hypothetical protein
MAVDACGERRYDLIAKPHKVARPEVGKPSPCATERVVCGAVPCHAERDPAI